MESGNLFDPQEGRNRRDKGIKKVKSHNQLLTEALEPVFLKWVRMRMDDKATPFAGEDWRDWVRKACLGWPTHPNWWGATWNGYVRHDYVVDSGEQRQSLSKKSHARKTTLWNPGPYFTGQHPGQ